MVAKFKAITTITWVFDSNESHEQCLSQAKQKLSEILDEPSGNEFHGFGVQVDLVRMKDRQQVIHIAEFPFDDVFPYITMPSMTGRDEKREYIVGEKSYFVRMTSDRYFVFKDNPNCIACGLEGKKIILDINPGDQSPHFNLYGEDKGRLVLMTKDHILAKSRGGPDIQSNFQVMCCICNNLKGNYDLSISQIKELRELYKNENKMPRKELRKMIDTERKKMCKFSEE